MREGFELYANVRPAKIMIPGRYEDIDIVLIRENLGGFYVAHEYLIPVDDNPKAVAVSTGMNTYEGSKRIARFAFEHALKNGRKKITVVHKVNILNPHQRIFRRSA